MRRRFCEIVGEPSSPLQCVCHLILQKRRGVEDAAPYNLFGMFRKNVGDDAHIVPRFLYNQTEKICIGHREFIRRKCRGG